jgi:hypothetical protein
MLEGGEHAQWEGQFEDSGAVGIGGEHVITSATVTGTNVFDSLISYHCDAKIFLL